MEKELSAQGVELQMRPLSLCLYLQGHFYNIKMYIFSHFEVNLKKLCSSISKVTSLGNFVKLQAKISPKVGLQNKSGELLVDYSFFASFMKIYWNLYSLIRGTSKSMSSSLPSRGFCFNGWDTHVNKCNGWCKLLFSHSVMSNPMDWSTLGFPVLHHLPEMLKLLSIESVMPSNHLFVCCPLFLLLSIFPSIRVFSNESALLIRWPKYWSFSFSISLSNEYSGLISFKIDWFDLLAVQGTLKGLLQHQSSKASILSHSAFFIVQLSHPYMTTRKTIALTRWTFVSKVKSLHFNTLSRFVIAFLPRSKCLLISWLQSPSAVI